MSFAHPRKNHARLGAWLIGVALLHVGLIWALMNGLARQVAHMIRLPIDASIIEEVKPPPEKDLPPPPPPKVAPPPPPAFVPPPEVSVAGPATAEPTITVTASAPPAAEPPPAPKPPPAPPAPPKPVQVSAAVVCSNYTKLMGETGFPREAIRRGLDKGDALVQFTITEGGEIRDAHAIRASHPIFAANSVRIVNEYKCAGQGQPVVVQVPFSYQQE
jgi:protein TonB